MSAQKEHRVVTVLCACIRRRGGGEVLLSYRRAPGVKGLDNKWELPGGKIEFGETPEQALVREIREEIGLDIRPLRLLPYLHTNVWEYEHVVQQVVLASYECELKEGSELHVSDEVRWFDVKEIDFDTTLPGTRDFISLALKNDWFDKLFIRFECVDPSVNANKEFAVAAQPTLFSRYGLVKYWGRIGSPLRIRSKQFDSPSEMDEEIFETAKLRFSHGYRITEMEGQVKRYQVLGEIIDLARKKHAISQQIQLAS
jgi:8-oxo-dGTP diphosphatase